MLDHKHLLNTDSQGRVCYIDLGLQRRTGDLLDEVRPQSHPDLMTAVPPAPASVRQLAEVSPQQLGHTRE